MSTTKQKPQDKQKPAPAPSGNSKPGGQKSQPPRGK